MGDLRAIDIGAEAPRVPRDQPAPMLQWVEIGRLRVNDAYQRPLNGGSWKAIRRIADDFRWDRFGPVLLAPLPGGLYSVVDGQHRCHAAAMCGFAEVPAMVVPMDGPTQAQAFVHVNTSTLAVTQAQVYRAALAAGEGWAVECHDCVAAAGCDLMTYNASSSTKKAGQVFAVGLVRAHVKSGRGLHVTRALAALRQAKNCASPLHYDASTLAPWFAAVERLVGASADDLCAFLGALNILALIDSAVALARKEGVPRHPRTTDAIVARYRRWAEKAMAA